MANERHEIAFVLGAIVGSVAGSVYGLFNAPQAGWRTRADLSGYAEELGDRVAHRIVVVTTEIRHLRGYDSPDLPAPDFEYIPVREPIASQELAPGAELPPEGATAP